MSMIEKLAYARTMLFVPADRGELIKKALASGADTVIVDLEDAVPSEAKTEARRCLQENLDSEMLDNVLVRINAAGTKYHENDLALCEHQSVAGIMLPKTESISDIEHLAALGKPIVPLVESAAGIVNLPEIVHSKGVARVAFGGLDFALDLDICAGTNAGKAASDNARFWLTLHSRAAGLPSPLDGIEPDIRNLERLQRVATSSRDAGFGGMLCIHPRQVAVVNAAFEPDAADIEWAIRVLAAAKQAQGRVFSLDGSMVDAPVIARAKRIVESNNTLRG